MANLIHINNRKYVKLYLNVHLMELKKEMEIEFEFVRKTYREREKKKCEDRRGTLRDIEIVVYTWREHD